MIIILLLIIFIIGYLAFTIPVEKFWDSYTPISYLNTQCITNYGQTAVIAGMDDRVYVMVNAEQ